MTDQATDARFRLRLDLRRAELRDNRRAELEATADVDQHDVAGDAETIFCLDYTGHQHEHRRAPAGSMETWSCPTCGPRPAEIFDASFRAAADELYPGIVNLASLTPAARTRIRELARSRDEAVRCPRS